MITDADRAWIELGWHFNPLEHRDGHGRWAANGGPVLVLGDPATARHVITYVPGIKSSTEAGRQSEIARAHTLKASADLARRGSTAVVVWGYSAPDEIHDGLDKNSARATAGRLKEYQDSLERANPNGHFTVIGHSYGSVVAGEAAHAHGMKAGDMVLIGSPGVTVRHAGELGQPADHVWAGAERHDPIARLATVLSPDFHGNPDHPGFGASRFAADEPGGIFPGIEHRASHVSYFNPDSQALPNLTAIATGDYGAVTPAKDEARLLSNAMELGWQDELRDAHGEWTTVANTAGARKEISRQLDEQGLDEKNPLRGVFNDVRGSHLILHRSQGGKIDAGTRYDHHKRDRKIELNDIRVLPERQGIGSRMLREIVRSHPTAKSMIVHGAVDSAKPWYAQNGAVFTNPFTNVGEWSENRIKALRDGTPVRPGVIAKMGQSDADRNKILDELELSWSGWRDELRDRHGEWASDPFTAGQLSKAVAAASSADAAQPLRLAAIGSKDPAARARLKDLAEQAQAEGQREFDRPPEGPAPIVSYPGMPHPSASSMGMARQMVAGGGLTREQHEMVATEVASHLDEVPNLREGMARNWKVRVGGISSAGKTLRADETPDHQAAMYIRDDLVKDPAFAQRDLASKIAGGEHQDFPGAADPHAYMRWSIAHEFGHAIGYQAGHQIGSVPLASGDIASGYGQATGEREAEAYAAQSLGAPQMAATGRAYRQAVLGLANTQLDLAGGWRDAWRHEMRGPDGRWISGGGMIDLYHHTTPENADQIRRTGRFTSPERDEHGRPLAFFTTERGTGTQAGGRGSGLVHIRVPRAMARLEDEFPSGEQHYSIPVSQINAGHVIGGEHTEQGFGKLLRKAATPFVGSAPHGEEYPGQFSEQIIQFWKGEDNPAAKQELNLASAEWEGGSHPGAARHLRNAAQLTGNGNRAAQYNELAKNIETAGQTDTELRAGVAAEANKAKTIVPGLLGSRHELWNGKTHIYPVTEKPRVLAELEWDGTLNMQDQVAVALMDARANPDQPVKSPDAFEVLEHEMIHGVVQPGTERDNERAYQNYATAQIEEGFTELGAIHHAPEFLDQMGVGSRQSGQWEGHTLREQAQAMQDPAEIAGGNAWGHYGSQTKDAQDWVQQVAKEEGVADLRPGTPGHGRVMSLTDEINRQGAAGKITVMARQLAVAMSRGSAVRNDHQAMSDLTATVEKSIREQWNTDAPEGAAKAAFASARHTAIQRVQEKEREMMERAA